MDRKEMREQLKALIIALEDDADSANIQWLLNREQQLIEQIDMLANFFLKEHQYKIRDGGAVENAIRLIKELTEENEELTKGTLFLIKKDKEVKRLTEEVERLKKIVCPICKKEVKYTHQGLCQDCFWEKDKELKQQIAKLTENNYHGSLMQAKLDTQSQKIKELEEDNKKWKDIFYDLQDQRSKLKAQLDKVNVENIMYVLNNRNSLGTRINELPVKDIAQAIVRSIKGE